MKLAHLLLILAAIFLAVCGAPTNLASGAAAPHPLFQTLFQNCKADQTFNSPPASFCLGYVTGVGEMMLMNGALRASPDPVEYLDLCGSDGLPSEKAMVEAVIGCEKHPEHWRDQMIIGAA